MSIPHFKTPEQFDPDGKRLVAKRTACGDASERPSAAYYCWGVAGGEAGGSEAGGSEAGLYVHGPDVSGEGETAMIVRVFRARLKPGRRGDFERLCRDRSIPHLRTLEGCQAVHVGRQLEEYPDEFVLVSVWRDLESLKRFAGEHWRTPLVLPGEAEMIESASAQHYDETFRSLTAAHHTTPDEMRVREALAVLSWRLTDQQWERVRGLLPPPKPEGRPRADDRRTLEGILYVLRTGCRWHDLPAEFGSAVTCWRRLTVWQRDGTWARLWPAFVAQLEGQEKLTWARALTPPGRSWTTGGVRRLRASLHSVVA